MAEDREQVAVRKEFITNRQGKDFVSYVGLLDAAHRDGLKSIRTTVLQFPSDANEKLAIVHATVETAKGIFDGIGDASPTNVGRMIAMHCVRMAETRAKARALRDAINVAMAAVEELGDEDYTSQSQQPDAPRPAPQRPASPPTPPTPIRTVASQESGADAPATQQQYGRLQKLYAACGRAPNDMAGMTYSEAASQITELVSVFNSQARGKAK